MLGFGWPPRAPSDAGSGVSLARAAEVGSAGDAVITLGGWIHDAGNESPREPLKETMTTVPPLPVPVAAVIADYPADVRARIEQLRALVWDVATSDDSIGELHETLKWGQPSFLTVSPRTGTTVRIDRIGPDDDVAVFTHCQTTLVEESRSQHGDALRYDGTRAVIVPATGEIPVEALREHIRAALLYHRR